MNFNDIIDDFQFLENWEDKYKYIIDIGNSLSPLSDNEYNEANKVEGCASQVWLVVEENKDLDKLVLSFRGDSDEFNVKVLIPIVSPLKIVFPTPVTP